MQLLNQLHMSDRHTMTVWNIFVPTWNKQLSYFHETEQSLINICQQEELRCHLLHVFVCIRLALCTMAILFMSTGFAVMVHLLFHRLRILPDGEKLPLHLNA